MSVTIVKSHSLGIFCQNEESRVFEFDENEFSYSQDAMDYIERQMMLGRAFEVVTYNEQTDTQSRIVNDVLLRAAGYGALCSSQAQQGLAK